MKKIFNKIALFCLIFILICPLVACNEHQHTFSNVWSFDEVYHWHESTCEHDEIKDKALHQSAFREEIENDIIYDVTYCSECGYVLRREVHVHTFEDFWEANTTHHWHGATCRHTELMSSYAEHDFAVRNVQNGQYDEIYCTVCGYILPGSRTVHVHTFDSEWNYDGTHHWHDATCIHDNLIDNYGEHSWIHEDLLEDGVWYDIYTCEVCDIYIKAPHAHTHSDSEYEFDSDYHWLKVTCGHDEEAKKMPHAFEPKNDIVENVTYVIDKCIICGYEKDRRILNEE